MEIKELEDLSFEPDLRRDRNARKRNSRWSIGNIVILLLTVACIWLLGDILIARSQSVLMYDDHRVQAVQEACEAKVRGIAS